MSFHGIPTACRCESCEGRIRCAFVELSDQLRAELDGLRRPCSFAEGTLLFFQGDPAEGVLLLRAGWVKLFHTFPDGEVTSLALLGSGCLLGLPEVLSGKARAVSAEAISACALDYLPAKPFLGFIERHGSIARRLLGAVAGEAHQLTEELARATGRQPSLERLLAALRKFATDCGRPREGGVRLGLSLTVQDLADRIGCSRQWTSKLLSDLEVEGLIHRRKGWITVTDRGLEAALAG